MGLDDDAVAVGQYELGMTLEALSELCRQLAAEQFLDNGCLRLPYTGPGPGAGKDPAEIVGHGVNQRADVAA